MHRTEVVGKPMQKVGSLRGTAAKAKQQCAKTKRRGREGERGREDFRIDPMHNFIRIFSKHHRIYSRKLSLKSSGLSSNLHNVHFLTADKYWLAIFAKTFHILWIFCWTSTRWPVRISRIWTSVTSSMFASWNRRVTSLCSVTWGVSQIWKRLFTIRANAVERFPRFGNGDVLTFFLERKSAVFAGAKKWQSCNVDHACALH